MTIYHIRNGRGIGSMKKKAIGSSIGLGNVQEFNEDEDSQKKKSKDEIDTNLERLKESLQNLNTKPTRKIGRPKNISTPSNVIYNTGGSIMSKIKKDRPKKFISI
jgi:hypothetical protein